MRKRMVLWLLLALPTVGLLVPYFTGAATYGQTLHWSGQISVGLLLLAMSVTPLRRVLPNRWHTYVMPARRPVGVASFGYAAFHTGLYLEYKWGTGLILTEGLQIELATGWAALAILTLLAMTSNGASLRQLGPKWQTLHRLVYLAALLTFAHWMLASFNFGTAAAFLCMLLLIELLRIPSRQRSIR